MKFLCLFSFLFLAISIQAQSYDGIYRQKVKSLETTIETLYDVISGDAGVRRDWDLFRYLFAEDAQLIPYRTNENGRLIPDYWSVEDYVKNAGPYLEKNGFFEKEISRRIETFGGLTHIFSTYESFRKSSDTQPFARGINSIQLLNDGSRWWIINIAWQSESDALPIPEKYLK